MTTETNSTPAPVTRDPAWKRALAAVKADNSYRYADEPSAVWSVACLSGMADCSEPEGDGTGYLIGIADAFVELVEYAAPVHPRDFDRAFDDRSHELADGAIPVYTARKWAVFTDCGAYSEDVSELVSGKKSITGDDIANAALYQIADRLLRGLAEEFREKLEAELDADDEAEASED